MLKMMRLLVVLALALSTLLASCSSVNRPLSQSETHSWGYYGVGSNQNKLVCRKTTISIYRDRNTPPVVRTDIVPDAKCSHQAKPAGLFKNPEAEAPTRS